MNKELKNMKDSDLIYIFVENNNQEALSVLVERSKEKLFTFIREKVKDRDIAEDIFQETWIKIIEAFKKNQYTNIDKFLGWAIRIAHNLCIDYFRKVKSKPQIKHLYYNDRRDIFEFVGLLEPGADQNIIKDETYQKVRKIIDMLPKEQREVVILRHCADLKFLEIAYILKCSVNTVLGRMRYALINIRKIIEEQKVAL